MSKIQKSKLVSVLDTLAAGPWQPATGWHEPRIQKNCGLVVAAGFSEKVSPLACVAVELLTQREPDTVRGIMYAVVSAGWLPDTSAKSYGQVARVLDILRKRGVVPFKWIVDNVRATEKP